MIIIPMAGLSSRFFKAGYDIPKYQLLLGEDTVFSASVKSFEAYFDTEQFLFIVRDVYDTIDFVHEQVQQMGIKNYGVVVLDRETAGQAETVFLGIEDLQPAEPLYIFNIDTVRYHYKKPACTEWADGYLEVFQGEGDHWSFILPDPANNQLVIRTTEKERISDYCSDGLYYFKSAALFRQYFQMMVDQNLRVKNELYIAPMYNLMILQQLKVSYDVIGLHQIEFSGTPDEYEALKHKLNAASFN